MEKIKFQHIMSICGICTQPLGVMEFMASGSLEKMLSTHSLDWQLKIRTNHEISLAVNFLHSIKPPLLHLDLKPGNILLDSYTHVKVSDFGLSKRMEQLTQMQCIKRSALQGTLSYIPPEMFLESNKDPGPKYDMHGFGIMIWELLTQKKPYSGSRADIIAETDMLLWLLQSPVAHHESEALAGKLSCAACRPGEVSEEICQELTDS